MGRWFQVSRGRLVYRGGITKAPFTRWTATRPGTEAIARVAATIRFSLLGRTRAARRRLWQALERAAGAEQTVAVIGAQGDRYMRAAADLAYCEGLPRAHVALHRLVLVPRAMIAARARSGLVEQLARVAAIAELDDAVRAFFQEQLLVEMDAALQKASVSPAKPVDAFNAWACVGVSGETLWEDPIWAGAYGTGHLFLYEFPRAALARKDRKALAAAIEDLEARSRALARNQRFDIVRAAQSIRA